jgi:hypothetical protein
MGMGGKEERERFGSVDSKWLSHGSDREAKVKGGEWGRRLKSQTERAKWERIRSWGYLGEIT